MSAMPLNFDSSTRPLGAVRDELGDEIARVQRGDRRGGADAFDEIARRDSRHVDVADASNRG